MPKKPVEPHKTTVPAKVEPQPGDQHDVTKSAERQPKPAIPFPLPPYVVREKARIWIALLRMGKLRASEALTEVEKAAAKVA